MKSVLITGAAGFIGMHLAERLLDRGDEVVGLDLADPASDAIHGRRLRRLLPKGGFTFCRGDIAEPAWVASAMQKNPPSTVVHLAARTGVRDSLAEPFEFQRVNVGGHLAVLEAARPHGAPVVYASSSSVYGDLAEGGAASSEDQRLGPPRSLYAATKAAGELMADVYAHLHGLPQTGLRLFSVYGPWGRPDMAYFEFTRRLLAGEPLPILGDPASSSRDYTWIGQVVDALVAAIDAPPAPGEHRRLNVGAGRPVALADMIRLLETLTQRPARLVSAPADPSEVRHTFADTARIRDFTARAGALPLEEGLAMFVDWYRRYAAAPDAAV